MSYKLTVKPSEELHTWLVFVDGHSIPRLNSKGQVLLDLGEGRHRLSYSINGPGGSIELDIAEKPRISTPEEATWPITGKIPAGETGFTDAVYFWIGQ